MYNWNQFRNFPKFKDMSAQEQARQYFLYQSNMMMEQSANAALAPAAAAAAAGAGGGGRLPKPEVKATESFLYWANFNIEGNTSDQTLKSSSINFTDGTTEVYDSGLTYGEYDFYNYPYPIYYSYTSYATRFVKRDGAETVFIVHDAGGKFVDKLAISTVGNPLTYAGSSNGIWGGFLVRAYDNALNYRFYYTDGASKFVEYLSPIAVTNIYNVSFDKNKNCIIGLNNGDQWLMINSEKITVIYEKAPGTSVTADYDSTRNGVFFTTYDSGTNFMQRVDVVRPDHTIESIPVEANLHNSRVYLPYSDSSSLLMLYNSNGEERTFYINYDGALDKIATLDYNPTQSFGNRRDFIYAQKAPANTGLYSWGSTGNTVVVSYYTQMGTYDGLGNYEGMDHVYITQGDGEFYIKEFRTPFWSSYLRNFFPVSGKEGFYMDYLTDGYGSGTYDVLYISKGSETSTTLWNASVSDRSYVFTPFGDSSLMIVQENLTDCVIIKNGVVVKTLSDLTGVNYNNYRREQYEGGSYRLKWGAVSYTTSTEPGIVNIWTEWDGKTTSFECGNVYIELAYGSGINRNRIGCTYPIYNFELPGDSTHRNWQFVTEEGGAFQVNHVCDDGYAFESVQGWLSEVIVLTDTNSSEEVAKVSFYSMLTGKLVGSLVTDSPFNGWGQGGGYMSFPWGTRTTMVALNYADDRITSNKYYGYWNGSAKSGYLYPFLADAPGPVGYNIGNIVVKGNDVSY